MSGGRPCRASRCRGRAGGAAEPRPAPWSPGTCGWADGRCEGVQRRGRGWEAAASWHAAGARAALTPAPGRLHVTPASSAVQPALLCTSVPAHLRSSEVAIIQAGAMTAARRWWKARPMPAAAARRASRLPPAGRAAAMAASSASALLAATLMPCAYTCRAGAVLTVCRRLAPAVTTQPQPAIRSATPRRRGLEAGSRQRLPGARRASGTCRVEGLDGVADGEHAGRRRHLLPAVADVVGASVLLNCAAWTGACTRRCDWCQPSSALLCCASVLCCAGLMLCAHIRSTGWDCGAACRGRPHTHAG